MNVVQGLLSAVSPLSDGDFADRLNYCVTTVGLVLTSAFISGWSFVGSPIQCWFPAYYKGWWMEYALDYCYVQNTYFIPMTDVKVHNAFDFGSHIVEIPSNYTDRETKQIGYYQWVPFILAAQAILFYLPVVLWRALYESSGFKVRAICDTCSMHANMDEISRNKNMRTIAAFLVEEQSLATVKAGKVRRITSGSYITMVYLVSINIYAREVQRRSSIECLKNNEWHVNIFQAVKFLYALNTIVQFIFLKNILGVKSYMWGLDVTIDLWQGREWPETGNFPRVTMCDYDVRVLGNLHRHTVQCVLMINMFNEKIFVVLWYWLCVMLIVRFDRIHLYVYSFAKWTIATATTSFSGRVLVNNFIQQIDPTVARSEQKRSLLQEFVIEKLRTDGVFLLRLVGEFSTENSGDMVTLALLKTLWKDFMASKSKNPPLYAEPLLLSDKKISAWEQYSENYCFVQNTYFVRPDHYIPDSIVDRENNEIGYYQWVPFILGLQAILFYLPALFWRLFNWQSGIAVKSLVRMARDTTNMQLDRKREAVAVSPFEPTLTVALIALF
uniref:Innexin n=1 Tax=Angiostrongylus cantonensis TaxID=6313 RepID=A0A0K0CV47_ANGCA